MENDTREPNNVFRRLDELAERVDALEAQMTTTPTSEPTPEPGSPDTPATVPPSDPTPQPVSPGPTPPQPTPDPNAPGQ